MCDDPNCPVCKPGGIKDMLEGNMDVDGRQKEMQVRATPENFIKARNQAVELLEMDVDDRAGPLVGFVLVLVYKDAVRQLLAHDGGDTPANEVYCDIAAETSQTVDRATNPLAKFAQWFKDKMGGDDDEADGIGQGLLGGMFL